MTQSIYNKHHYSKGTLILI